MRRFLASAAVAAVLSLPSAAAAQVIIVPDGLVDVTIGDITIQDVNVNVAANIAAGICANLDLNAAVLAVQQVDESGSTLNCEIGRGGRQDLTITNN